MSDVRLITTVLPACMLGVTYVWLWFIVDLVRKNVNVVDAIMQIQTLRLFILVGTLLNVAVFLLGVFVK